MRISFVLFGLTLADWTGERASGFTPKNADLKLIKSNLNKNTKDKFFRPHSKKVDKTLRKILKKWDTKLQKRLRKTGCMADTPTMDALSEPATCSQQAIQNICDDFKKFLNAYIKDEGDCSAKLTKSLFKVEKLAKRLQKVAKQEEVTDKCPSGFCRRGRCAFDLHDGGFASTTRVVGKENELFPDVIEFSNIKYAWADRFRSPVAKEDYTNGNFAEPGKSCVTVQGSTVGQEELQVDTELSEDCLYLRIFVPKAAIESGEVKKVVSWIHGGTHNFGGVDVIYENPAPFVMEQDIIVAKMNYRLGPFGNWYFPMPLEGQPQSSWGFQDQRAAMKWIQDHIPKFGGDPADITLAGASAGGQSVLTHVTSPASHSFFNNAMALATPMINYWTADEATTAYGYISIDVLECTTTDDFVADAMSGDLLECLQGIPLEEFRTAMATGGLVFKQLALTSGRLSQMEQIFAPNVDGDTISGNPRELIKSKSADVKSDLGFLLIEVGANEGTSMAFGMFNNDEFKQAIYGENYAVIFQEFNQHVLVPKPAHDGLLGALYEAAGAEFIGALLTTGVLGCEGVDGDPYGGLLTECKDHTSDWITSWVWTCSAQDAVSPYNVASDPLGDKMYVVEFGAAYPGPDHREEGVMLPDTDPVAECYEQGFEKSCHIAGQSYLFGEAVNQGIEVQSAIEQFAMDYRAAYGDLIKNGVAQTTLTSWTGTAGQFNLVDIDFSNGGMISPVGAGSPFSTVCPLFDGMNQYGNI